MDKGEAIEILKALAEGINPLTGEVFPPDSLYHDVRIVRALFKAIESLQAKKQRSDFPANAGTPWLEDESKILGEEFDSGLTLAEMAQKHQRSRNAIAAQLVRIGKVNSRDEARVQSRS